jgi:hypothetical protein
MTMGKVLLYSVGTLIVVDAVLGCYLNTMVWLSGVLVAIALASFAGDLPAMWSIFREERVYSYFREKFKEVGSPIEILWEILRTRELDALAMLASGVFLFKFASSQHPMVFFLGVLEVFLLPLIAWLAGQRGTPPKGPAEKPTDEGTA